MNLTTNNFVTIGIPFYNAEDYLEYAIRSVINQTYLNWELILLDDGSNDNSLEIAKAFSDNRIRIISDGINKGLISRLNQLSSLASGEFYARMDADDIMHFDRIALQVEYLKLHRDVDVVGSNYYSIDTNNKIVGSHIQNTRLNSITDVLKYGCFAHPTVMGRTEWFKKNLYDESCERMEDYELWIRTVQASKFYNLVEPLLFYRSVGVPTLNKYIKSNINIIKLLQYRRKYQISFFDSATCSGLYALKILVYFLYYCFGKMDSLVKRRSQNLIESEKFKATEILLRSISCK